MSPFPLSLVDVQFYVRKKRKREEKITTYDTLQAGHYSKMQELEKMVVPGE